MGPKANLSWVITVSDDWSAEVRKNVGDSELRFDLGNNNRDFTLDEFHRFVDYLASISYQLKHYAYGPKRKED